MPPSEKAHDFVPNLLFFGANVIELEGGREGGREEEIESM